MPISDFIQGVMIGAVVLMAAFCIGGAVLCIGWVCRWLWFKVFGRA